MKTGATILYNFGRSDRYIEVLMQDFLTALCVAAMIYAFLIVCLGMFVTIYKARKVECYERQVKFLMAADYSQLYRFARSQNLISGQAKKIEIARIIAEYQLNAVPDA
jgi:hypothetical protein